MDEVHAMDEDVKEVEGSTKKNLNVAMAPATSRSKKYNCDRHEAPTHCLIWGARVTHTAHFLPPAKKLLVIHGTVGRDEWHNWGTLVSKPFQ